MVRVLRILTSIIAFTHATACSETELPLDVTGTTTPTTEPTDSATDTTDTTSGETGTTADVEYPEPTYGLSSMTLFHDKEERQYLIYVPDAYDVDTPVPVMLNFHGFGGSANEQLQMVDMRPLADTENFILIYPQGTILDGFSHWNTYLPGGDNKSEADDFGFISVLLDELALDYHIDASRVYATGFSNGVDFTYTLACFIGDQVTGIAPVSGLMWTGTEDACELTHPTAVMSFHGTNDFLRPYDGLDDYLLSIDDSTAYFNAYNNITQAPTTTQISDGVFNIQRSDYVGGDGGVEQVHYKITGGPHIWFSFEDEGVETRSLIWNFLSQYDRDGLL